MADPNSMPVDAGLPADKSGTDTPGTAVSWDLAERVAAWVGNRKPLPDGYRHDELQREFAELTAQAEELVAASTGLRSPTGLAPSPGTYWPGWGHSHIPPLAR